MPRKKPVRYSNRIDYEQLLGFESKYGGEMFGPVPKGHNRSFFKDKENVWIWYENWINSAGKTEEMIIRYEVRPSGVFRRVGGNKYEKLSDIELDGFRVTAKNYLALMKSKLYY